MRRNDKVFKDLYDNFTENIINHNLKQMVKIPHPKQEHTWFISHQHTKSSSWNQNVTRITSDHDIVFNEIKVKRGRIKQNPRQVKSYKKAN